MADEAQCELKPPGPLGGTFVLSLVVEWRDFTQKEKKARRLTLTGMYFVPDSIM